MVDTGKMTAKRIEVKKLRKEASIRMSASNYDSAARPMPPSGPRERVRPVRRRRKRSVWRKTVFPLMTYACVFGLAVAFVGRVSRPFVLYGRESHATHELQKQIDSYRSENAALERKIKYLKTPEGAAQAARELGWVKPGEITLVIPDKGAKTKQ